MAKRAYIGVTGLARKVKKGYIGAPADRSGLVRSAAGTLLYTYSGRNYKKALDGEAACTSVVVNGWLYPLLVAKTANAVAYKTDGNYESEQYSQNTFTYKGETWHVSTTGAAYQTSADPGGAVPHLNSITGKTYASILEAASDLLDYYTMSSEARRIQKTYIGIGGVARPCGPARDVEYYGVITPLSVKRFYLAAAPVGGYALFYGGQGGGNTVAVDAYDSSLTRTVPASSSAAKARHGAGVAGEYAVFAKGTTAATEAYSASLTRTNPSGSSISEFPASVSAGTSALFAGGGGTPSGTSAYNAALSLSAAPALTVGRMYLMAAAAGGYALFCGGRDTGNTACYNTVDAYDASLTRTAPTALSAARSHGVGASAGGYALICGGVTIGNSPFTTIDVYDGALTRMTPIEMSISVSSAAGTTLDGRAVIYSGTSSGVNVFDKSLTRTIPAGLSLHRQFLAAAPVGDYALFAGGYTLMSSGAVDSASDTVDAYVVP